MPDSNPKLPSTPPPEVPTRRYAPLLRPATLLVEVTPPPSARLRFGEFLVRAGQLSRENLLQVLMRQDRAPRKRIGECVAELGLMPALEIDYWFTEFTRREIVSTGRAA